MVNTKLAETRAILGVPTNKEGSFPREDDFYATPPEATRALFEIENFQGHIWDPACGDGAICKVAEKYGYTLMSTDLVDRG